MFGTSFSVRFVPARYEAVQQSGQDFDPSRRTTDYKPLRQRGRLLADLVSVKALLLAEDECAFPQLPSKADKAGKVKYRDFLRFTACSCQFIMQADIESRLVQSWSIAVRNRVVTVQ
jgi:hypothetical protein